jgi:hypothetical protein
MKLSGDSLVVELPGEHGATNRHADSGKTLPDAAGRTRRIHRECTFVTRQVGAVSDNEYCMMNIIQVVPAASSKNPASPGHTTASAKDAKLAESPAPPLLMDHSAMKMGGRR